MKNPIHSLKPAFRMPQINLRHFCVQLLAL
jgi:hypothetical protein